MVVIYFPLPFQELRERLRPFIVDTVPYMNKALKSGKNILIEGAQSNVLDIDFGECHDLFILTLFC